MTDATWDEYFKRGAEAPAAAAEAPSDWGAYLAPGLNVPKAAPELRAPPGDKYRADAQARFDWYQQHGMTPPGLDTTYAAGRGAGFGWGDEIMAGAMTPFEMIRKGTLDPREGYRYGKAYQDLAAEQARGGAGNAAAEVAGGLVGGAGVLGAGTKYGAANLPRVFGGRQIPAAVTNWTANTAKAGGLGAVYGAGESPDIEGIPGAMVSHGLLAAGLGGVVAPIAAPVVKNVASLLQAPRLRDPEMIAVEKIAEAARNAGVAPEEISRRISEANAAGQPFTVADAIGHEGQRLLTAQAKVPGPQRAMIEQTLAERNLNMPYRTGDEVVSSVAGTPVTARQAQAQLLEKAKTAGAPLYREAEQVPTWSNRLDDFLKDPEAREGLATGMAIQRREARAANEPFDPHDYVITDFNSAGESVISPVPNVRTIQAIKKGVDNIIADHTDKITGEVDAVGRSYLKWQQGLLAEVDKINPKFAEARATYADPMQVRSAIRRGQEMKRTGRAADNIEEYRDMRSGEQAGVRVGYANDVAQQLEQTGNFPAQLREKAVKGKKELEEFSRYAGPFYDPKTGTPQPDPLRKFLNREETMLATSHKALGGSSTIENMADVAAGPGGSEVLGLIGNAAAGNVPAVGGGIISMLDRARKGESEAQRVAITNALLAREPPKVEDLARRLQEWELRRRGVNPWTGTYRIRP